MNDHNFQEMMETVDMAAAEDRAIIAVAERDGRAAGGRMASYWVQLMKAGIPAPIAGGLIMQYQAVLLGSTMPMPAQRVEVHHAGWGGEVGYGE